MHPTGPPLLAVRGRDAEPRPPIETYLRIIDQPTIRLASIDLGGSEAQVRGEATELDVMRIGLGPELRWSPADPVYLFGRLSPEAVRVSTELVDSSSDARLGPHGAVLADIRALLRRLRDACDRHSCTRYSPPNP